MSKIAGNMLVQDLPEEDIVPQLRCLAELTPPVCGYDIDNTGPVYCKPFEQFQLVLATAADEIEWLREEMKEVTMNKEQRIKQTLITLGVRAASLGYVYLVDAVSAIVDNPHAIRGICKGVYADIANKYNVKYASVERCIRYAIEESYTTAPLEVIERIFGNSVPFNKTRPTARHYIAAVADHVRSEIAAAEAMVMAV